MKEHEHLHFICLFTMKCRGWISSPHLSETLRCTFRNITAFIARFMHCFASLLIHKFSCTTNNLHFCKWQRADSALLPKHFHCQNLQCKNSHLAKPPHGLSNHISVLFLSCRPRSFSALGLVIAIDSCGLRIALLVNGATDVGQNGPWDDNHRYKHWCHFE